MGAPLQGAVIVLGSAPCCRLLGPGSREHARSRSVEPTAAVPVSRGLARPLDVFPAGGPIQQPGGAAEGDAVQHPGERLPGRQVRRSAGGHSLSQGTGHRRRLAQPRAAQLPLQRGLLPRLRHRRFPERRAAVRDRPCQGRRRAARAGGRAPRRRHARDLRHRAQPHRGCLRVRAEPERPAVHVHQRHAGVVLTEPAGRPVAGRPRRAAGRLAGDRADPKSSTRRARVAGGDTEERLPPPPGHDSQLEHDGRRLHGAEADPHDGSRPAERADPDLPARRGQVRRGRLPDRHAEVSASELRADVLQRHPRVLPQHRQEELLHLR